MTELGKYWRALSSQFGKMMIINAKICPVRRIDIAGVASSILATPTMIRPWKSSGF